MSEVKTVAFCDTFTGNQYDVAFCKGTYKGQLFLQLYCMTHEMVEDQVLDIWLPLDAPVTIYHDAYNPRFENYALINVPDEPYLPQFLMEHGFAKPTGVSLTEGSETFHEFAFDMEKMQQHILPYDIVDHMQPILQEQPFDVFVQMEEDDEDLPF